MLNRRKFIQFSLATTAIFLSSPATLFARKSNSTSRFFKAVKNKSSYGKALQIANEVAKDSKKKELLIVMRGYLMAAENNHYNFERMADFIDSYPDWPYKKSIIAQAEKKLLKETDTTQQRKWFEKHAPISMDAFHRQISILNQQGKKKEARTQIQKRWVNGKFTNKEMSGFLTKYSKNLAKEHYWQRLDHQLWQEGKVRGSSFPRSKQMFKHVDKDSIKLAKARIALAQEKSNALAKVKGVPDHLSKNEGLAYEKLRYARRTNRLAIARNHLPLPTEKLEHPHRWSFEQNALAHIAIDQKEYWQAYSIASYDNSLSGQFLAGRIAYIYLRKTAIAAQRFENALTDATIPSSIAKVHFWLGRTHKKLGNKIKAKAHFKKSGKWKQTFYGQLSLAESYKNPKITIKPEPIASTTIRNHYLLQSAKTLSDHGQNGRAQSFFKAMARSITSQKELTAITQFAQKQGKAHWAVYASEYAETRHKITPFSGAYPLLPFTLKSMKGVVSLVHGIIRQESQFNEGAGSHAGAKGLMQLMKGTAKEVGAKIGKPYSDNRIYDPNYNVELGTDYLKSMLRKSKESKVLALSSYNAGPGNTNTFIRKYGDPRKSDVDTPNWLENIFAETGRYVELVLANEQCYTAVRSKNNTAPITVHHNL